MVGVRGEHAGRAAAQRTTLRQRQKDATRSRITKAALALFSKDGFQAVNIDAIAREAGIARTTFYLHFATKTDLANAIAEPLRPVFKEEFRRLGEAGVDASSVQAWLEHYLATVREHVVKVAVATQANVSDAALGRDLTLINEEYAALVAHAALNGTPPTARELAQIHLLLLTLERYSFLVEVQHAIISRELRAAMTIMISETIAPLRARAGVA